jgi:hypothetical protein
LRTGKVHISPVDPNETKPFHILKVDVNFSMAPVLKSIAAKWSSIESMEFSCTYFIVYKEHLANISPHPASS